MNGTPSDWACIAAAEAASTGPPRTRFRSSAVSTDAEPAGSQPPDEAHPLHVGDEVHGLGDRRELVRPDRQEQEDRPIGVAPDDVAEEPEGVVVGPLDVVDEQRERADPGERRDRDARQVESPQELGVRRQALEPALVTPGDGLDDSPDRRLGGRARGRVADGARREQAPRDEERPADLLVGRDGDAREPARRCEVGGGEQQARLADARLALEGHRREAAGRLAQLLGDRVELSAPSDDRAGRAAELDGERALRPDEWVEHTPVHPPRWRASLNGRRVAQHAADYDAAALNLGAPVLPRNVEPLGVVLERGGHLGQRLHQGWRAQLAAPDGERGRVPQPLLHQDPCRLPVRQQVVDLVEELEPRAGGDAGHVRADGQRRDDRTRAA